MPALTTRLSMIANRLGGLPAPAAVSPALLLMASLRARGWHRSAKARMSVDAEGKPIPWMTYPAIHWLGAALRSSHTVFEYGAGQSTLWLASRVARVTSIESNQEWASHVGRALPANVEIRHVPCPYDETEDRRYPRAICGEGVFDLVIVDGPARNACIREAAPHTSAEGLILLDDSDRQAYRPSHQFLEAAGYGRIDFEGPRPGLGHISTTSIFCRDFRPWLRALPPPAPSGY